MGKVRRLFRRVLLVAVGAALIVFAITMLRYQTGFPAASLTLTYVDAANVPTSRSVGDLANPRADLSASEAFTLHFSTSTTVDVAPGTELQINTFGQQADSVQVVINLRKGQIRCHVGAQPDSRAYFQVVTPVGATVDGRQADFVMAVNDQDALIGARYGSPTVTFSGKVITLTHGSGITLVANAPTTAPVPKSQPWATVRMPLFAPDGTLLSLPLTLARADSQNSSSDSFYLKSGDTLLIPDGTYTPTIRTNLPGTYALPQISVPAGQFSEWPSTLSELQFGVVDSANKPVSGIKLLNLNSGSTSAVLPDTLLVPANKTLNFTLARLDAPDQKQPTGDLSAAPGQRLQVPLRSDLFGGGSLQVSLINADGTKHPTGNIALYTPGTEDAPNAVPLLKLKTDETPVFLAHGDYVAMVSIPNSVTRRYPVTITANTMTPLVVKLGALTITYNDSSGHAVSAWLYVASDADLKRLGQTVDQARNSVYGYVLRTGQPLTIPAGDYTFRIDALHSPTAQTITIAPGQNPPLTVTAVPSP
jgi:hypothetical protein